MGHKEQMGRRGRESQGRATASRARRGCATLLALASLVLALAALSAPASAAEAPAQLWTAGQINCKAPFPDECGVAGEVRIPRGIAAAASPPGHLYVANQVYSRIDELTAWGRFVKAFGFDVAPEGAPGDTPADRLETCTATCKAGIRGPAPGQLAQPQGIALDSAGDVYVVDWSNHRVQKFDPEGNFVLMFGGEVNKTTSADLCTKADLEGGEECGAGVTGAAPGQFSAKWPASSYIAIGPGDEVYVGDESRIQRFDTEGAYQDEVDVTGEGKVGEAPKPGTVGSLAADPQSGELYFAYPLSGSGKAPQPSVYRLDPD